MEGGRQAGVEETGVGVGKAPRRAPAPPPATPLCAWYPATSPLPEAASRTRELAALSAGRPCWPREARSRPSTVAAVPASRQRRVRAGRGAGGGEQGSFPHPGPPDVPPEGTQRETWSKSPPRRGVAGRGKVRGPELVLPGSSVSRAAGPRGGERAGLQRHS